MDTCRYARQPSVVSSATRVNPASAASGTAPAACAARACASAPARAGSPAAASASATAASSAAVGSGAATPGTATTPASPRATALAVTTASPTPRAIPRLVPITSRAYHRAAGPAAAYTARVTLPSLISTTRGSSTGGRARVDAELRELRERAALFYRLGVAVETATARLIARVAWEHDPRPAALADAAIDAVVRATYARRPSGA